MRKTRRADTRAGMTVTTVALPDAMHMALKVAALEDAVAVNEIMREAVAAWLARRQARLARTTRRRGR